jgi:hypothetical protein
MTSSREIWVHKLTDSHHSELSLPLHSTQLCHPLHQLLMMYDTKAIFERLIARVNIIAYGRRENSYPT